jgi:hypothetical protein
MTLSLLSLLTLGLLLLLGLNLAMKANNSPARKSVPVKIRDQGAPHDARTNRFD